MSVPIRVIVDWNRMSVCEACADKIGKAITCQLAKIRRGEQPCIDVASMLCDDCFSYNVENGAIRIELDPRLVRGK